jgi:hypothetical protein
MAEVTRRIGLSLGADLCWPLCYEEILARFDARIPQGKDVVRFAVERVSIEPFDLRQPCRYDLVVDRLTHWYSTSREWIKKSILMDGLYVFNNPWAIQSMEKHTTYTAMMALGFPIPDTWMIPPKAYEQKPDLDVTLGRYAKLFDLGKVGAALGYPMYMKPYDGGGWQGVSRIDDEAALRAAYESSGTHVMHLQKAIEPYDRFVRAIGLGPQVRVVLYDPAQPLHDRYTMDRDFASAADVRTLTDMTLTINAFFGWDFNSCEALSQGGTWHPIDFANACPDSQVTSLHYHFPWLVIANLEWSLFVAATKRPMRQTLDWAPFQAIAREKAPFGEKLAAYAAIARGRLDADRFAEFKAQHLGSLAETAWEFFGTEKAKEAVRLKTRAMYPAHEVEEFTELFWSRIQRWRDDEAAGAAVAVTAPPAEAPASAPAPAKKARAKRATAAKKAPQ